MCVSPKVDKGIFMIDLGIGKESDNIEMHTEGCRRRVKVSKWRKTLSLPSRMWTVMKFWGKRGSGGRAGSLTRLAEAIVGREITLQKLLPPLILVFGS